LFSYKASSRNRHFIVSSSVRADKVFLRDRVTHEPHRPPLLVLSIMKCPGGLPQPHPTCLLVRTCREGLQPPQIFASNSRRRPKVAWHPLLRRLLLPNHPLVDMRETVQLTLTRTLCLSDEDLLCPCTSRDRQTHYAALASQVAILQHHPYLLLPVLKLLRRLLRLLAPWPNNDRPFPKAASFRLQARKQSLRLLLSWSLWRR
jgi:hypothetical protein